MSVCIKTRVIYQVQHFSFFVCCMFTILCYFKNAFKRLQRELKQICSRIGHMAGFYCTLPIPGGMMNIQFCNIMLCSHHVSTLIYSAYLLESWYLYLQFHIGKYGKATSYIYWFQSYKNVLLRLDQPVRWTFFHIYL